MNKGIYMVNIIAILVKQKRDLYLVKGDKLSVWAFMVTDRYQQKVQTVSSTLIPGLKTAHNTKVMLF